MVSPTPTTNATVTDVASSSARCCSRSPSTSWPPSNGCAAGDGEGRLKADRRKRVGVALADRWSKKPGCPGVFCQVIVSKIRPPLRSGPGKQINNSTPPSRARKRQFDGLKLILTLDLLRDPQQN